jgi:hypothetical protein
VDFKPAEIGFGKNRYLRSPAAPAERTTVISDLCGYSASALVLLTFTTRNMRVLRAIAILSNIAFIIYGALDWLPPVLILHALLLPLNIVRLKELLKDPNGNPRTFLSGLRNPAFTRRSRPIAVPVPRNEVSCLDGAIGHAQVSS